MSLSFFLESKRRWKYHLWPVWAFLAIPFVKNPYLTLLSLKKENCSLLTYYLDPLRFGVLLDVLQIPSPIMFEKNINNYLVQLSCAIHKKKRKNCLKKREKKKKREKITIIINKRNAPCNFQKDLNFFSNINFVFLISPYLLTMSLVYVTF